MRLKFFLPLRVLLPVLLLLCSIQLSAQVPQVGETIDFAGMELKLTDKARRDIQSSVDALYRSEKFFNLRLEQVDLYMPLIEPIFTKYGVPQEFKYLVIQESGLVPDAVSSSNAVGFWQFKEASAEELGLRVDHQVDERMNIISSTEGAAKYLLRSNAEFDNWVYSLQSYMVGQGGTSRSVNKRHYGAREMKIDDDTHWYIKKFLAHLIAFEPVTGKQTRNTILYQYKNGANKSLKHIAREFDMEEEELIAYNKWIKASHIPDDKEYTVIVPLHVNESEDLLALTEEQQEKEKEPQPDNKAFGRHQQKPGQLPAGSKDKLVVVEFNDLEGVVARPGDNVLALAEVGGLSESRFRRYNDLLPGEQVKEGQFYYLEKKRRRARVYEHVLKADETLWQVAQQYGIRLEKLKEKNRLTGNEKLKAGRVLWLRFIRPPYVEVEHRQPEPQKERLYASTRNNEGLIAPRKAAETEGQQNSDTNSLHNNKPQTETADKKVKEKTLPAPVTKETETIATPVKAAPIEVKADTPVHKQQMAPVPASKTTEPLVAAEEDSLVRQEPLRKFPSESKEKEKDKALYPDEEAEAEVEGFVVDEPVRFIEDEKSIPQQQDSVHVVQAGETLYSLSRQYQVSVQQLVEWNHLPARPVLSIGQQLRIIAPQASGNAPSEKKESLVEMEGEAETAPQKAGFHYHTVEAGESMYRVARMYNVTIKDIMEWNNKENFDIREGEQLIVGKQQE